MQANDENKNLEYCRYYHGEQQNPYRDSFKGRAWMAEQLARERASDSAKDFLSFVAAHISKWEPYGYEPDVARYIAFFEGCSFEEKIEIAIGYGLGDALQFKKPRGRTIFESHSDALKVIQMRVSILLRQLIWVFCSIATGESILRMLCRKAAVA